SDLVIANKVREAVNILHKERKEIIADGDIQANFALSPKLLSSNFPFSTLDGEMANTLIFPNLESGNIAYKLLQEAGGAEAVGPILLGMNKPIHVLQLDSSVREIVIMVTIAVVDVQAHEKNKIYNMYEYLRGSVITKAPTYVVLEVGGIGYYVHITLSTYSQIKDVDECKLFISFQVR